MITVHLVFFTSFLQCYKKFLFIDVLFKCTQMTQHYREKNVYLKGPELLALGTTGLTGDRLLGVNLLGIDGSSNTA